MKKFLKIIGALSAIAGLITFGFWLVEKPQDKGDGNEIILQVTKIDVTPLTNLPKIDGLTVDYRYNDSLVQNLWSVKYSIKNIGLETIIGFGKQSDLISRDFVKLIVLGKPKFKDFKISNKNFPIEINGEELKFKQWKPGEFIEISALIETQDNSEPQLSIDNQDIINCKIENSIIVENQSKTPKLIIDYFPSWLKKSVKWIIVITIVILIYNSQNQMCKMLM